MGRQPVFFRFHLTPYFLMAGSCTRPTALAPISKFNCAVHFDQFVGLLFQRGQATPSFATEAELQTLAKWTALLTAPDGSKVVKTPEFADGVIPGSEPQFADQNSNASIDGLGYFTGFNSVQATGNFVGLPSDIRTQLSLLEEESRPGLDPGLTAYIILRDGRLVYNKDENDIISGVSLTNFYMASLNLQGFKALNKNAFGFTLDGTWDKYLQVVKPDFNPRTAL